jgi:DNA-directed RNA polymerase subunit RPC12/RpoP
MLVESAVEVYLLTCARCNARWTESYQVNQVIDDSGLVSSFYRRGGVPVEAPAAAGNVQCPNCGSTRVRQDRRFDETLARGEAAYAEPIPRRVPGFGPRDTPAVVPRQHGVAGTWHRYKFSAVIGMEKAGRGHRQYNSRASGLMVRAANVERPAVRQYFPAVVFTEDGRPLVPGDHGIDATISVPDDNAAAFFQPGQRFALWDGTDVGHGTVAYHLLFTWPELS